MKIFKRITLMAAALMLLALSATAGLQVDAQLNGGTNAIPGLTTNKYVGTVFDFSHTTAPCLEFSFTATNLYAGTATITYDCSMNQEIWQTNALTVTSGAANGTNSTVIYATPTSPNVQVPYWRVGQIWNTNAILPSAAYFSNVMVRAFSKTGL